MRGRQVEERFQKFNRIPGDVRADARWVRWAIAETQPQGTDFLTQKHMS